jgi:hypothetical protein
MRQLSYVTQDDERNSRKKVSFPDDERISMKKASFPDVALLEPSSENILPRHDHTYL